MKIKKLTCCAMLSAMCAVLGYISMDMMSFKISFESLPVLLGGFLFGPLSGALIGTVGTLIYQLLKYGVSLTTVLWILPYTIGGLICGLVSKSCGYRLSTKKIVITVIVSEFLITLLNTGVIYLDSKIYGWYYPTLITASLVVRLIVCAGKSAVFAALISVLIKPLRDIIK